FAGMRNYDGVLHFSPYLPDDWDNYKFTIKFKGREILIEVDESKVSYSLLEGENLVIKHINEDLEIPKNCKVNASLKSN
ncbi:MAG: glycosyl hydrolase family 65 protein, partial [Bacillota bacterium]